MTEQKKIPTIVNPEPPPPAEPTWENLDPEVVRRMKVPPAELADDIMAMPLTLPDFVNNIQPHLVNQNLTARWIFTNPRRYAQARAQGYRNCTKSDLKADFATLCPFEQEGGTKYVNGDLVLMLIDRRRYLGALRRKHEMADRLATDRGKAEAGLARARHELASVQNVVRQRGQTMEAFDPYAEGELDEGVAAAVSRMGHDGPPDIGGKKGG